jgi:hypothetical protein
MIHTVNTPGSIVEEMNLAEAVLYLQVIGTLSVAKLFDVTRMHLGTRDIMMTMLKTMKHGWAMKFLPENHDMFKWQTYREIVNGKDEDMTAYCMCFFTVQEHDGLIFRPSHDNLVMDAQLLTYLTHICFALCCQQVYNIHGIINFAVPITVAFANDCFPQTDVVHAETIRHGSCLS